METSKAQRSGGKWKAGANLSVVISTWNRSHSLRQTLASISRCRIPAGLPWELVLVNNNCTDDTDEVVVDFGDTLPILYVKEPRQGLSRARNAGLAAASGELIVFTDDDVEPCEDWIALYWSSYRERPSGFYFGGPIESRFETSGPTQELLAVAPAEVCGFDWGETPKKLSKREYFIAPNWACPAEPLRALGGFDVDKGLDPSLGMLRVGEETDLMERLETAGFSAWYLPQARVRHFVPARKCTLGHIAARGEADSFYETSKSLDELDGPRIVGIPRWMYRRTISHAMTCVWAKLSGNTGHGEYVRFRRAIGAMKAFRQLGKDKKRVANPDVAVTN